MVTSYRNCAKVLSDLVHFNSQKHVKAFVRAFGGLTMESIDSPRHHQMRGVWARDFQRDGWSAPSLVEVVDARLGPFVERLRAGEVVDAVPHMTRRIPTLVIANMLGIEPDRHRAVQRLERCHRRIGRGGAGPTPPARSTLVREGRAATGRSTVPRRRHRPIGAARRPGRLRPGVAAWCSTTSPPRWTSRRSSPATPSSSSPATRPRPS